MTHWKSEFTQSLICPLKTRAKGAEINKGKYYPLYSNYNKMTGDCINSSSAKGVKSSVLDEGSGQMTQFCNKVFGGWDFCISNQKAAKEKHKNLTQELRVGQMIFVTQGVEKSFLKFLIF